MQNLMGFSNPSEIKFGNGAFECCLSIIKNSGKKKIMVVADPFLKDSETIKKLEALNSRTVYINPGEPAMDCVDPLVEEARNYSPELIIAIGGGSAIDTAKIIRALISPEKSIGNLLNWDFDRTNNVELYAIPTTAGTGSEVTKFAIVNVNGIKETLIDSSLIPTAAFIDPDFLKGTPERVLVFSAVDAMTHNIESLMSKIANPVSTRISYWGAELSISNLRKMKSQDLSLDDLAAAATLGGLSINHGSVCEGHMLGHMLGSNLHIPHGQSVGLVLPAVIDYNLKNSPELRKTLTSLLNLKEQDWNECGREIFKILKSAGVYDEFKLNDFSWKTELLEGNWFNGSEYVCRTDATDKNRTELFERFNAYLSDSIS